MEQNQPCSVRQVYYLGCGVLWPKDTGSSRTSYKLVVRYLGEMREDGTIPFGWITDSTRWVRKPTMWGSHGEALERTAKLYRRNVWEQQPERVEVWAESDSVSGIIHPVTEKFGVGLFSCRGQASKDFAHSSAQEYLADRRPVQILYCGDFDPTGRAIPRSLLERLNRYTDGGVDVVLRRIAVTADDVLDPDLDLVAHAANTRDPNWKAYAVECERFGIDPRLAVEIEAIPPTKLRSRLQTAIRAGIGDPAAWTACLAAESSERAILGAIAGLTDWLTDTITEASQKLAENEVPGDDDR
ncbi:hypothetical protein ACFV1W_25455 [Kitasatospora sp. NPDC059648]|uniref:hypothetical protein n=1 Tax=Kitasatospora sp. NPDC059648 TaxID=3346894 RepID=UPI0036D0642A